MAQKVPQEQKSTPSHKNVPKILTSSVFDVDVWAEPEEFRIMRREVTFNRHMTTSEYKCALLPGDWPMILADSIRIADQKDTAYFRSGASEKTMYSQGNFLTVPYVYCNPLLSIDGSETKHVHKNERTIDLLSSPTKGMYGPIPIMRAYVEGIDQNAFRSFFGRASAKYDFLNSSTFRETNKDNVDIRKMAYKTRYRNVFTDFTKEIFHTNNLQEFFDLNFNVNYQSCMAYAYIPVDELSTRLTKNVLGSGSIPNTNEKSTPVNGVEQKQVVIYFSEYLEKMTPKTSDTTEKNDSSSTASRPPKNKIKLHLVVLVESHEDITYEYGRYLRKKSKEPDHPMDVNPTERVDNVDDDQPLTVVDTSLLQRTNGVSVGDGNVFVPDIYIQPYRMVVEVVSDLSARNLAFASEILSKKWDQLDGNFLVVNYCEEFEYMFNQGHVRGSWTDPCVLAYIYRKMKLCSELRRMVVEESPKSCYPDTTNETIVFRSRNPVIKMVKNVVTLTASSANELESMENTNVTCRNSTVTVVQALFSDNERPKNVSEKIKDYENWSSEFYFTFMKDEDDEKEEQSKKTKPQHENKRLMKMWTNEQVFKRFSDKRFAKFVAFINEHMLSKVVDFETFMEDPLESYKKIVQSVPPSNLVQSPYGKRTK